MKLLLAVDGSDFTQRMLDWLAAHEDFAPDRTEFVALTVVPRLPPHVSRHLDRSQVDTYELDRANEILAPVTDFGRRHGWRLETRWLAGRAAELIADAAAKGHHDLIVLGSHGHSAVGSLLLGSVAQGVLARCQVPVLIVR